MQEIQGLITRVTNQISFIDLSISRWDFMILIFFGLVSIGYAFFFVNRGKITPLLFATYMAFVLVQFAPFLTLEFGKRWRIEELYQLRLLAFGVIFLIILFVLSRVILQSPVGSETLGIIPSFLLAVVQTGFLIALVISFLPHELTEQLTGFTRSVFVGNDAFFYWAVAPVLLLLIFGQQANRKVG